MNSTVYSCGYEAPSTVYWIRHIDITVGVVFMLMSVATLFINAFVIYAFFTSKRKLQGTSLILLQVAFNDFISGIVGIVFCSNLLSDRTLSVYSDSKPGNVLLCQVYGILLDIIYIAAPLLLAIATALRVFAVLAPYNYQKINTQYTCIPIGLSTVAWVFGAGVGLFPFFFGKWMCFSQVSGSCDYFVINVLGGDTDKTRIYSLCLFVIPGNVAYIVIVVGGMIVIGKLFRQNRKTVKRTTSRMEDSQKKGSAIELLENGQVRLFVMMMLNKIVQNARRAFANKSGARRASESELKMMQKELSVIKCTLILCATYFIAHFVTVAYNVVYMFRTNNSVFRTMSGNSATGEVYLYSWFYLSHTLAGFVDGLVQVQCNNEMQKEIKRLASKITSSGWGSQFDFKGSLYTSVNRFTSFNTPDQTPPPTKKDQESAPRKKDPLPRTQGFPRIEESMAHTEENVEDNGTLRIQDTSVTKNESNINETKTTTNVGSSGENADSGNGSAHVRAPSDSGNGSARSLGPGV